MVRQLEGFGRRSVEREESVSRIGVEKRRNRTSQDRTGVGQAQVAEYDPSNTQRCSRGGRGGECREGRRDRLSG